MVSRTVTALWASGLFAAILTGLLPSARAQVAGVADLSSQREKQKQIQAQTDQMVRRVGTMLRVLEYYELDKTAEKELLSEVATTLNGLSREQMTEIIARLEAAATAPEGAKSDGEQHKAYLRHREVLQGMRGLLLRYDSIRDVQQLAERFEKAAYTQVDLHLSVVQLAWRAEQTIKPRPQYAFAPRVDARNLSTMLQGQIDEQGDLTLEVQHLLEQFRVLRRELPPERQALLNIFESQERRRRLPGDLSRVIQRLNARGRPEDMLREWLLAAQLQWSAAGDLQESARQLQPALEKLPALRVVRQRVDETIRSQDNLFKDAQVVKERDPLTPPASARIDRPAKGIRSKVRPDLVDNPAARDSQELANKQGRLEHETRGVRRMLMPLVKGLADRLPQVEKWMWEAQRDLRDLVPDKAMPPQQRAADELRYIRSELDRLIAEAEKQRTDPVAALKNVAETIDQLIKEQKETKQRTEQAENGRRFDKLPQLSPEQQKLAGKTEEVKRQPMPEREATQKALDKAVKAMENASQQLDDRRGKEAVQKQVNALNALEEAKKQVEKNIAEIEKRRDDIANLEDAAKKLGELAKQETKVADQAKAMADQPAQEKNAELAKQQAELTPQAKEVAKQVEKAAPEAAKKVDASAKHMEAAKKEIDQNKLTPASKEAKTSAKKLEEAMKDIAKSLEQKKSQEVADQAALNKQTPADAAQQLAKALEQTQLAAKQSERSDAEMSKLAQNNDLAKLQQQIADKAKKLDLKEAVEPADEAAKSLRKEDLKQAIQDESAALEKLKQAAAKEGQSAEAPAPKAEAGEAKAAPPKNDQTAEQLPGEAKSANKQPDAAKSKAGQKMEGEAKTGQPKEQQAKAGEAKSGQVKNEQSKPAVNKPAQPPEGQAKAGKPKSDPAEAKAKSGQPKSGDAKAGEAKTGAPKEGQGDAAQAKGGEPIQGEAKEGQVAPKPGEAKTGQPEPTQAKAGQDKEGQAKGGQPAPGQEAKAGPSAVPSAQNAAQLAQAQQKVLDATKALAESQKATQAAMAALGQAQAQAPQAVQPQLKQAAKDLSQAAKQLDQGSPNSANQAQGKAAGQMEKALQSMNEALAKMGQPGAQPGQMASASPKPGPGQKPGEKPGQQPGQGKKPGQGKGQKPGQGEKPGPGLEKNEPQGTGQRVADGKVSNGASKLNPVESDGTFLHLPARQRELIQQALSQSLPPEYAAMIQQYYINIARGRPAVMPNAPPKQP